MSAAAADAGSSTTGDTVEEGTGLLRRTINVVSNLSPTTLVSKATAKIGGAIGNSFGDHETAATLSSVGRRVGMAGSFAVTTALGANVLDAPAALDGPAALDTLTSLDPGAITELPETVGDLADTALAANPGEAFTSLDPSAITESPGLVGRLATEAGKGVAVQKSDDLVERLAEQNEIGWSDGVGAPSNIR